MSKIYPILLAGGSGTRLWPLSRKSYPKQFAKLMGETTLFQSSAQRLTSSNEINFLPHITLTNSDFRFIVGQQLQEIGIDPGPILIEPESKNTAAAILAASLYSNSLDKNAILLVAPSDHVIPNKQDFHAAIKIGLPHVHDGKMVTFGIRPTRPDTGYGYLELMKQTLDQHGTADVYTFVEKPDEEYAEKMFSSDNFLWNAGIFLFRAKDMIDAFKNIAPKTLTLVKESLSHAKSDLGFLRLAGQTWSKLEDISIDYAIMEKAQNLVSVPLDTKWSDLGGWDAVWSEGPPDEFGNVITGSSHALECKNTLLRSESSEQQLVGVGLEDIMAIAMPDAVLIAHKTRAQDIKQAVKMLKSKDIDQAEVFPKDHRPWGWFESLIKGDGFQVKRIFVHPGEALSLQSHKYRSEHWVVVTGTARVTINETEKDVKEGHSIFIPLHAKHRLANFENSPLTLIEIQIGSYLGEDDIVRYEDNYNR